ncbi:MAG: hypothetical protein KDH20_17800 [Rhodocyclaceae bacterium]|nr:hypothetical protein [Rhodocyclaceae bacterium]
MRKEYGKVLRKACDEGMAAAGMGWERQALKSLWLMPGERAYARRLSDSLTGWCVLSPHAERDSFTIDIGWSRLGRFPELGMRPSALVAEVDFGRDECWVRLGELATGEDICWEVGTGVARSMADLQAMVTPLDAATARARVLPCVEGALAALQAHGEAFLAEAARHGAE